MSSTATIIVQQLSTGLAPTGVDVVQPLQLQWYNQAIPVELGARIKPLGREDCLVVLVGNSKQVWEPFLAACGEDADLLASEHPFNLYIERALQSSLAAVPVRPRIYWSHKRTSDLDGGCQYVAMQRMAQSAGLAFLDHDSHLSLHPKFGPWFSLRCALVFDDVAYEGCKPAPMTNPMSAATQRFVKVAIETAIHCAERRCAKAELMAQLASGNSTPSSSGGSGTAPTAAALLAAADRVAVAAGLGRKSGRGLKSRHGSSGSPRSVTEESSEGGSVCSSRRCSGESSCERDDAGESYDFAVHSPESEVVAQPTRCSMDAVRSTWRRWVAVRDAPSPGHPWRYCEDQLAYHYTADREVLLQALIRRKLLPAAPVPEGSLRSLPSATAKLVLSA